MIEILLINDKKAIEYMCEKNSCEYNYNTHGYSLNDNEKELGSCIFSVNGEDGVIYDISVGDESLIKHYEYALGKAALNYMDLHGVKTVISNKSSISDTLLQLEFVKNDNASLYKLSLDGYFNKKCKS